MKIFKANLPNVVIIAFVLAAAGFDVWMMNTRGNVYSRNHLRFNPDVQPGPFWQFSFDKIGLYDIPACIAYIKEVTGERTVKLVAHSQTTSSILCLLSEKPGYNEVVSTVSLMAPIAYLGHLKSMYAPLARIGFLLEVININFFCLRMIILLETDVSSKF